MCARMFRSSCDGVAGVLACVTGCLGFMFLSQRCWKVISIYWHAHLYDDACLCAESLGSAFL